MAGKINLINSKNGYCFFILAVLLITNCKKKPSLLKIEELNNYPSGSGIEYFNDHFFLIGDDATHILKLDNELKPVDTINLYNKPQKRIPKNIKTDLESITLVKNNNTPVLLLTGSGSLNPYRNIAWLVNPATKEKTELKLDTFYHRLAIRGIGEINIEGLTKIPGGIVLANRGNKTDPRNYLIFTSDNFWKNQAEAPIRLVRTGINTDTSSFNGISGLDYSAKTDRLLLTVSTENTYNSYADGAVGKSYLWIINDLMSKRRMVAMNPDKVIDLNALDKRFSGHKIESVCITSATRSEMNLMLISDDDNGKTMLFKINLPG